MLIIILSDLAEYDASIFMVIKHNFIYFWTYFGDLLRQEISPYIEIPDCNKLKIYLGNPCFFTPRQNDSEVVHKLVLLTL